PAVLAVGSGTVQDHLGFVHALAVFVLANQEAKWLPATLGIPGAVLFQKAAPADLHDLRIAPQATGQRGSLGKRLQVGCKMLLAGRAIGFAREGMLWILGTQGCPAQRRGVHAERAEQANVAPALEMLCNPAALINGDREVQLTSIQSGFQTNG